MWHTASKLLLFKRCGAQKRSCQYPSYVTHRTSTQSQPKNWTACHQQRDTMQSTQHKQQKVSDIVSESKRQEEAKKHQHQYHTRSQSVDPTELGVVRDSNGGTEQPVRLLILEQCHRHKVLTVRHIPCDLTPPCRHEQQ
mmetsp:Transcript_55792/g.67030  ORF Transcript_55792/g.67030 Transcript_55792/m.67030 type:complete len:139 (+) Transcript_55792:423-839(+)